MLYGIKVLINNIQSSLVVAATTIQEYDTWCENNIRVAPDCSFTKTFTPEFLDVLTNPLYKGYKQAIRVYQHNSVDDQETFFKKHGIKEVLTAQGPDKQSDMVHKEERAQFVNARDANKELWKKREDEINAIYKNWKAALDERRANLKEGEEIPEEDQIFYIENEYDEKTIAEELGIDEVDPWDNRTEEEKEKQLKIKEKIEKARKEGKISGDSFGDGPIERAPKRKPIDHRTKKVNTGDANNTDPAISPEQIDGKDGEVFVTKINVTTDANGAISVHSINAVKKGGEVDEEAKAKIQADLEEQRQKIKKKLTPFEFANKLLGDRRHDSVVGSDIVPDAPKPRKGKGKVRKI